MTDLKRKLRLIAIFTFFLIITLYACYFITIGKYPTYKLSLLTLVLSFLIYIFIYSMKENEYSRILVSIFGNILPFNKRTENRLNEAQLKYKKLDERIRSKPFLYYSVIFLIIILSIIFISYLTYLSLQLYK